MVDLNKRELLFIIATRTIKGIVRESECELKIYINQEPKDIKNSITRGVK
jgi:hypothetical protein